jgi:hypothetical protein
MIHRVSRLGNMKVRDHSEEDLGIDGKIIHVLDWILGKWGGKMWTGFIWLRIGTNGGPSGSKEGGVFFD